jgi:hypothetical protein
VNAHTAKVRAREGRIAAQVLTLEMVDHIEQFLLETVSHRGAPTEVSTL